MKVFGVTGWKNSGKTGLVERLVKEITRRGVSVSTVKHAHHSFDVDQPGKDSFRHRAAGAREVLLSSRKRWALMHETDDDEEAALADLLAKLEPVDLVLVEGFKRAGHKKIETHRKATSAPLIATEDASIVALAADYAVPEISIPLFDLDDTDSIADFVLADTDLAKHDEGHDEATIGAPRKGLRNDCFALPEGVDWIPVETALETLRARLPIAVGTEAVPFDLLPGRILAVDAVAQRSSPPHANSAVDGYGMMAAVVKSSRTVLPLAEGRSAAGSPFSGHVPQDHAVRILTGALVPSGVDTVVMQEDVALEGGSISFEGTVKKGANIRLAGEDASSGAVALAQGTQISAPQLALMAAVGLGGASVFRRLRVGVLSTGDELLRAGDEAALENTYDANGPMLLSLANAWGYEAVDLGHVGDDISALRQRLNAASNKVDAILTSGGASAGEEDHMSAILNAEGQMFSWRIALKPGRPLALGLWQGVPIFGLPGNPVAAFVCALMFAHPALSAMSGAGWNTPQGFDVPAAFEKRKKAGRHEYLRARLNNAGGVEVFASEGSGRISGLDWADGLVELDQRARDIRPGDMVRYIPFSSFGI